MKWKFNYYVSFGPGDGSDCTEVEAEITPEEEKALAENLRDQCPMEDSDCLQETMDRLYDELSEEEGENLLECGDSFAEECEEEDEDVFEEGYELCLYPCEPEAFEEEEMEALLTQLAREGKTELFDALANYEASEFLTIAFRVAVREGMTEFVRENIEYVELEDPEDGGGSFLEEAKTDEMRKLLTELGAESGPAV